MNAVHEVTVSQPSEAIAELADTIIQTVKEDS